MAFVQTLQEKALLSLAKENLAYYDHVLDINRERYKAGGIAQVDLKRLEVQRVQYLSDLQNAVIRPGHVFPLRVRSAGVLARAGQTEAAVDLARLAGLYPAGVICEIMNQDGTMARVPQLADFARRHGLLMVTVADLIAYRMRTEMLVERGVRRVPSACISESY
jgi:3,4-dihydroxy-2-butanone 4-phosphate synthase